MNSSNEHLENVTSFIETTSLTPFSSTTITTTTLKPTPVENLHICQCVLFTETDSSTRIRYWDLFILIPNLIFLLFLLAKFKRTWLKLRTKNSPIIYTFYFLVCINVATSILRCLISMLVNAAQDVGGKVDQIFWVIVRFFLLSTEISVPVFALFFGHLESRKSIQRVLMVTCSLSLAYSICQGSLELIAPDEKFYIQERQFHLFAHGGMLFWFVTCSIFALIYFLIFLLPWSPCANWFFLPVKPSFYVYSFTLCVLNVIQAIGSGLFYSNFIIGLCMINTTTYLYFTLFTPFVYWTFLAGFFMHSKSDMLISYPLNDDGHENIHVNIEPSNTPILSASSASTVSVTFPQQLSISSVHTLDFVYHQPDHHVHGGSGDDEKNILSNRLKQTRSYTQLRQPMSTKHFYRSQLNALSSQSLNVTKK